MGTQNAGLCPIDLHCHGVGRLDFDEEPSITLDYVEARFKTANVRSILTLYLPELHFSSFVKLVETFQRGRRGGDYRHIVGLALEGPLLASHGGTPPRGVWSPTKNQWQTLAQLGDAGLTYVVLSPDFERQSYLNTPHGAPSVEWLADCLLEGGVLPAPGHFLKDDANASALAAERLFSRVERCGRGPTVTDHLYNDMPLNFRHAWRTSDRRERRVAELADLDLGGWRLDNLEQRLGAVPAAILRAALRGVASVCVNFDGEHVDLEIAKRTVELIGANKFLLMTDRIESRSLAGQELRRRTDSTLLYQGDGIVAGGSQSVGREMMNMRSAGFEERDVQEIAITAPAALLGLPPTLEGRRAEAVPRAEL